MKAESQMKAAKTKKNLKEMPYSPLKNFLKRKENNILEKKSIILESDQRNILPFLRLFWEEQQKYLQSSQNKDTYHSMNPIVMLHIKQSIYLVLTNVWSS